MDAELMAALREAAAEHGRGPLHALPAGTTLRVNTIHGDDWQLTLREPFDQDRAAFAAAGTLHSQVLDLPAGSLLSWEVVGPTCDVCGDEIDIADVTEPDGNARPHPEAGGWCHTECPPKEA